MRAVLGLDALGISYADPYRDERGWAFTGGRFTDEVNGFDFLKEAYLATEPGYDGRISVPVLWDKEEGRIVSNESADIVVFFNEWAGGDLYPRGAARRDRRAQRVDLQRVPERRLPGRLLSHAGGLRRGVPRRVRARWSGSRALLGDRRYLAGEQITLADWRLLPTLLRFDAVYHTHFRCNGSKLVEYPNLLRYTTDLYRQPHVAETFALDEIKRHYYTTHDELNPKRIIPAGPLDLGFTCLNERSISRLSSRSLIDWRLSPTSLPRASAISTFAWRSLK